MPGLRTFLKRHVLTRIPLPLALAAKQTEVVLRCALARRYYEPEAAVFLDGLRILGRRGIAIDVGANLGQYAIPLARLDCCSEVLAIEPQDRNVAFLRRAARLFGRGKITAVRAFAGQEPGTARLVLPSRWGAPVPQEAYMQPGATSGTACPVITLDSLATAGQTVIALKLDIEGAELLALDGARTLLLRDRPLVLAELNDAYLARFGASRKAAFAFLHALDYRPYCLRHGRLEPWSGDRPASDNYFLLQPAHVDALPPGPLAWPPSLRAEPAPHRWWWPASSLPLRKLSPPRPPARSPNLPNRRRHPDRWPGWR